MYHPTAFWVELAVLCTVVYVIAGVLAVGVSFLTGDDHDRRPEDDARR